MSRNYVSAADKEKSCPYLEYIAFNLDEDFSGQVLGNMI